MSITAASAVAQPRYSSLLPAAFILGLFGLSFAPRVAGFPVLETSFQSAAALLAIWHAALLARTRLRRRTLEVEFNAIRSHYVQALVQSSVYFYWATAWPFIAGQFVLIVGQWCFAYACTMLIAWTRREKAEFGFGLLPIILSTNFFLCFRDEWFYLQFLMIAVGVFGKEFLRWQRDGRNTHIFNPSVLGLSVFSLAVILTGTTGITWAQQNAIELGRPEHIYLWIFAVGLVVQYLFEVTLVTFAAAAALWVLNLIYTQVTGVYWFLDAGIPIAVFLGLHLLVTDPATSPRNNFGRAIFGALYGGGVFLLYAVLEWAGAPRFYDKLLFVPVLNLLVPAINRYARGTRLAAVAPFARIGALTARRQNLLYMALWMATFAAMYATHVVGPAHPGKAVEFWKSACTQDRQHACRNLRAIYQDDCFAGHVSACFDLAGTVDAPRFPAHDPQLRDLALAHACDLGDHNGCRLLDGVLRRDGDGALRTGCDARDAQSCYALGTVTLVGLGREANREAALGYFAKACELRLASACGNLAEMHRFGVGTRQDWPKALSQYEKACALGYGAACVRLGELFAVGDHVPHNELRAAELYLRACRIGTEQACTGPPP
jgi:hypothetical protein